MTAHQLCQYIVSNFVEKANWSREIKIAKKLIIAYPQKEFWQFVDKSKKYPSLNFFLCQDGKDFLAKQTGLFNLVIPDKPAFKLSDEKIGIDIEYIKSPKSVIEFLRR